MNDRVNALAQRDGKRPPALGHHPHGLAVEEAADVFGNAGEIVLVVLLGDIAEMRRDDGIVHLAQRMIDGQRLDIEYVEACAGDFLLAQGGEERVSSMIGPREVLMM